jgi:hypothetical protein
LGKGIAGSVVSSPVERHLEDTFDNQSVKDNDFDRDSARKNAPRAADDRKHIRRTIGIYPKGGSTEITLCAEVAGLTNISQSIPPWINEKTAGMLRVKPSLYESSHPG